jgi:GNAT superfamily N-acetyltransferase
LNGLDPANLEAGEDAYVADIRGKVRGGGRQKVEFEKGENVSTAKIGGKQIAEVTYEQFPDGYYWVTGMYTDDNWQRLGIAKQLIATAIASIGGTLYASNQGQVAHEDQDDEDTRWLTGDGAALINAAIAAHMNVQYRNPFEEPADDGDGISVD